MILDVGLPLDDPTQVAAGMRRSSAAKRCPAVPGLFEAGENVDAVLLSHAHGDHAGLIDRVLIRHPDLLQSRHEQNAARWFHFCRTGAA